ncbi:SDR family oxidoreductase [Fictibacillus fluitans]|uniref:SDR family oxidoreductase n=1 Tax=Fictibacillus fluitans TaxID=3058422 RepID=A0ABT8HW35_9BACL|nr:SDR family oxidoreductase [Fictibacillus sp. NE201]MDN4524477.1 SDR family oxidoreductase [Fictibacillus sp. NE201]
MKVAVAGANGTTGRLILQELAGAGHEAKAIIRKKEQASELEQLGAETVLADLEGDLSEAVRGCDAVIFAAGSGSKTGPDKTEAVDRDGAIKLMEEAEKQQVKRFIMLSSMGAGSPEKGPEEMQHYLRMKGEADDRLESSRLHYTIVRPGALTNDEGTGEIKIGEQLGRGSIPRADVAKVIVQSLDLENANHKIFEILEGDQPVADALKSL